MSDFYADMRSVADSLLGPTSPFKQGVLRLRRILPGDGPAHNPGIGATVEYPLSGTVRGVQQQHVDGTLVVIGDKVATISVPEVEPLTSDKLLIDGKPHPISKVDRKPAAGPAVAYLIFAKV